jgi:vancomycin resistance protein VanJ
MINFCVIGGGLLTIATWGYLLFVLSVAVAINYFGDYWWPATILLFTPRWLMLAPAPVLFLLIVASRRHHLLARGILAVFVFGIFTIVRFELPSPFFQSRGSAHPPISVLTLNCDYGRADATLLQELVEKYSPEVVQFQGASSRTISVFDQSWHTHRSGQLFTASRYPIDACKTLDDPSFNFGQSDAMACTVRTSWGTICLVNLHFASPRDALELVISQWWGGRDALRANSRLREQQTQAVGQYVVGIANPTIITGDFNTVADSPLLRRHLGNHFNAFSEAGWGIGNTHFTRRTGVRIDHILASPQWKCRRCVVLSNVGADHRPVFAEFEYTE